MSIYESTQFFTYGTIFSICTFGNQQQKNPALKIFQCVQFLQFCQSTNLRGFSPMVQFSGSVNLEINNSTAKKNPALKIFQCLQFWNFVNLRIYAVFHLWYNIQDMYIWKSTAKKSSFKNFSVCPISTILSIYESTRFFTYGTIFMICYFENQLIN